jgi:hypothetical protein
MSARGIAAPDFSDQDRADSMIPDDQVNAVQNLVKAQKSDPDISIVTSYPIGLQSTPPADSK